MLAEGWLAGEIEGCYVPVRGVEHVLPGGRDRLWQEGW